VELAALAKYPFVQEASAFIRAEQVTLEELLSEPAYARARAIGRARVLEALEKGPDAKRVAIATADQLSQLLAYPVARILVSVLEDTYLIRRFALREAIAAENLLDQDSDDAILHIAAQLSMDLRREDGGFRIHFSDFLRFTSTMRDTPWKLINQPVQRGYVRMRREKALRVMRNAIQRHIEAPAGVAFKELPAFEPVRPEAPVPGVQLDAQSSLYDPEEKVFKIWYLPRVWKSNYQGWCYAVSRDGYTWEKPDLGLYEYNGSKKNNILNCIAMASTLPTNCISLSPRPSLA